MPAQHYRPQAGPERGGGRKRAGLRRGTGRGGIPHPGEGGYDYPRGPYGATGFPGSTPAALRRIQHSQGPQGRKDPQFMGRPLLTTPDVWERDTGPEFLDVTPVRVPRPQPPYGDNPFTPGTRPQPGNRYLRTNGSPRLPRARQMWSTSAERRMIPVIGAVPMTGRKPPRNTIAQRWKAVPGELRAYRPSPNPGKTGAHLQGPAQYHPGVEVHGDPDGGPIPGMPYNPDGTPPQVTVLSRYVSAEGGMEGYAMNRPMLFTRGGTPAPQPHGADPHIRGARMSGQRYFGAIIDQQRIGLPSDSYGISRRRGPRHRPVRFDLPTPWTANYYDVPTEDGTQDPDMIHRSPVVQPRQVNRRQARRGPRATGRGGVR